MSAAMTRAPSPLAMTRLYCQQLDRVRLQLEAALLRAVASEALNKADDLTARAALAASRALP